MIMTSSPLIVSHAHTPLESSPISSPSLRPVASTMAKSPIHTPGSCSPPLLALPKDSMSISIGSTGSNQTSSSISPGRSYARAPPVRPYQSPLLARRRLVEGTDADGETAKFAQLVLAAMEDKSAACGNQARRSAPNPEAVKKSLELIVDIPVWSPGCFTDLSTLHALRDTTLSHTHAVIAHLSSTSPTPVSYRLLARCPNTVGWGCVRLAPSSVVGSKAKRRTSFVKPERSPNHNHNQPAATSPKGNNSLQLTQSPPLAPADLPSTSSVVGAKARHAMNMSFEQAIADDDEDEDDDDDGKGGVGIKEKKINLKSGYSTASDTEDEEEADTLVKREIERRGGKEG